MLIFVIKKNIDLFEPNRSFCISNIEVKSSTIYVSRYLVFFYFIFSI